MFVLTPITITDAMVGAATSVPEPASGETAWVSGGTYAVGDLRIRSTTHYVYSCVQAHTGRTALPEVDAAYWLKKAPTQRWAPFDIYKSTACTQAGSISYVLRPGFFNALALYGVAGSSVRVTIKDAPGGNVIYDHTRDLYEPPGDWYEYLFGSIKPLSKIVLRNLPIHPNAELTVAIIGTVASLGMLVVGDCRPLMGGWGGTQYGASTEPVSYDHIKIDPDGTTTILNRGGAMMVRATVMMAQTQADAALRAVEGVRGLPVAWISTDIPGYSGLNAFGLGSGILTYAGPGHANLNLTIKGLI